MIDIRASSASWASERSCAARMVEYCATNSPMPDALTATEVGTAAAFLSSDLATGITGTTVYVDKGYHAMGMAVTPP